MPANNIPRQRRSERPLPPYSAHAAPTPLGEPDRNPNVNSIPNPNVDSTPNPNVNKTPNPNVDSTPNSVEALRVEMRYTLGSRPQLEDGVRTGNVVIGRLRIYSRYTAGLAFVSSSSFPCDVVVRDIDSRNRAQHGDIVAVELARKECWPTRDNPTSVQNDSEDIEDKILDEDDSDDTTDVEGLPHSGGPGAATRWVCDTTKRGDGRAEVRLARALGAPAVYEWDDRKPFGRVLATLERTRGLTVVARLKDGALGPEEKISLSRFYHFQTYDPLLPHIAVFGRDIPQVMQPEVRESFFLLQLLTSPDGDFVWTSNKLLTARVLRLLGDTSSIRANSLALCSAFAVNTNEFSEEAVACIPENFEVPDHAELQRMRRRDLRVEEFVCSIDPSTARDLDDALSITRIPSGYRVGVHIADVSYFVPAGSPLDEEARERSTSVYLVEQVIPMLPRKLSEDYCSLNPGSDKFAFSCIFHLDHHGKVQSEWFGQSVIRNRCRLSYEEAQRIIDGDLAVLQTLDFGTGTLHVEELRTRVVESITMLYELASKMRTTSLECGRLTIGNTKIRFDFEDIADPKFPIGFSISRQIQANWLVEEFMLLANRRTAEKILEYLPDQALLRHHVPPDKKKIKEFRKAITRVNLEFQGMSSKALQKLLDIAKSHPQYDELCTMLKYSLTAAKYFVNGCEPDDAFRGHYALAMPWYTHFTSPIRRYCDVIAHRQLLCALEIESILKKDRSVKENSIDINELATRDFFYPLSEVEFIVENANAKKVNARQLSDTSLRFFFCQYLKALNRVALANQKVFLPRVTATVVRVLPDKRLFTLFAAQVALEVEVSLNDGQQLFMSKSKSMEPNSVNEAMETNVNCSHTDNVNRSDTKNNKHRKKMGNPINPSNKSHTTVEDSHNDDHPKDAKEKDNKKENRLIIHWGPHPVNGEEVTEEVQLFSTFTALLIEKRVKGYVDVGMIVDPPWKRDAPLDEIATVLPG